MKRILSRVLVMALTFSLVMPLPIAAGPVKGDDNAHVHARLNSPERKALIDEARLIHEAARAAFEQGEGKSVILSQAPQKQEENLPEAAYEL